MIWNITILAIKLKNSSGLTMLSTSFFPNLNFSCELWCAKWEEITLITRAKYERYFVTWAGEFGLGDLN